MASCFHLSLFVRNAKDKLEKKKSKIRLMIGLCSLYGENEHILTVNFVALGLALYFYI